MKICAHEWSARPHVGRESRICGRCNEWEVDVELSQARAAIVSLGKQRGDAYLDLREAREAHKAERDELEKHLSEAEDERAGATAKLVAVAKLLEENGCDCECDHCWEYHDETCERCLACLIEEAILDKKENER